NQLKTTARRILGEGGLLPLSQCLAISTINSFQLTHLSLRASRIPTKTFRLPKKPNARGAPPAAASSRRAPVRFLARSAKTESDRKVGHYKNKGLSIGMGRPERGRDSRKLVVGRDGAGMLGIGVLGLHAIEMFVDFEGWFEEAVGTDKEALVA